MARKARDYTAEYAARKNKERQRAATESRPFSMARARGHVSREHESRQRRVRKLAKDNGVKNSDLRDAVKAHGWEAVEDRLESKARTSDAYLRGDSGPGHDQWESADRDQ